MDKLLEILRQHRDIVSYILSFSKPETLTLKFKDGTIVNSEENKIVIFNNNILHTGSTCTDEPYRFVINFNFFREIYCKVAFRNKTSRS